LRVWVLGFGLKVSGVGDLKLVHVLDRVLVDRVCHVQHLVYRPGFRNYGLGVSG